MPPGLAVEEGSAHTDRSAHLPLPWPAVVAGPQQLTFARLLPALTIPQKHRRPPRAQLIKPCPPIASPLPTRRALSLSPSPGTCAQVIKRFIMHAKKTAFIVEHDFIMATYLADRVVVYEGKPSIECTATSPQPLLTGMNQFLKQLEVATSPSAHPARPAPPRWPGQALLMARRRARHHRRISPSVPRVRHARRSPSGGTPRTTGLASTRPSRSRTWSRSSRATTSSWTIEPARLPDAGRRALLPESGTDMGCETADGTL
jgi:hypothetical protein